MKKSFAIALLLATTTSFVHAQYKENAIKVNSFGFFVSQYQFAYERALSEKASFQLSAGFLGGTSEGTINGDPWFEGKRSGYIVIPEMRYYFDEALVGWYAAGFFRMRSATWDVDDLDASDSLNWSYERTRSAIGGGVVIGHQVDIASGFILDIFLGPQIKTISKKTDYDDPARNEENEPSFDLKFIENDGVGIRFGVNLGYAF